MVAIAEAPPVEKTSPYARKRELDAIAARIRTSTPEDQITICEKLTEADRWALYKRGELVALSTIAGRDFESYYPSMFEQSLEEACIPLVPVIHPQNGNRPPSLITTLPVVDTNYSQAVWLADKRLRPFLKKQAAEQRTQVSELQPPKVIFESSLTPELIAAAQAGNHEAFEAIFNQYQKVIYNYIYRLMGNQEDAFDFTQDTFLKAYQGLPKTRQGLHLGPWLYRIATNTCLDELRHRNCIKWSPWEAFISRFHPTQVTPDSPEKDLLDKENHEEVQLILDRLHPKYRICLILREYQNLSYDEIADVLNTTSAAVKSLLFRARQEFRYVYARSERQPQILPHQPVVYAGNKVR